MNSRPGDPNAHVRLTVLAVVVGALFITLFVRLWFLQAVNAHNAQAASQTSGIRTVYIPAPRGNIISSDGQVLAGNQPSVVVTVQRQQAQENPEMEPRLAALLGIGLKQLQTSINNNRVSPYAPVPVDNVGVTNAQVLYIKEHQALFPGVDANVATKRVYPLGSAAANIIGYTSQINSDQYKMLKSKDYNPDDQVGDAGIEETQESVLRGKPGVEKVQVDAKGDVLGVQSYTPPVPGSNVVLTINSNDQKIAYNTLQAGLGACRAQGGKFGCNYGSIVIENPGGGQMLGMASAPDYDDNQFVGGIKQADYQALLKSPTKPLINEAISGGFLPGSTFKLVSGTAGLQTGIITPTSPYDDTGSIKIGTQTFHDDSASGVGGVTLPEAISQSIDTYFYNIGQQMYAKDPSGLSLINVAKQYGFGQPTGVGLPNEIPGLLGDQPVIAKEHAQFPKLYPTGTFFQGDEMQEAIGQDAVVVTPMQLANAYATFANGGTHFVPQIVSQIQDPAGKTLQQIPPRPTNTIALPPDQHAAMLQGFQGVDGSAPVGGGPGTAANAFKGFPIPTAGKTGTAQVQGASTDTSVFSSFAPAPNPQFVVDCFVDQGGYGADTAAPIVRSVYNQLFNVNPGAPITITTNGAFG